MAVFHYNIIERVAGDEQQVYGMVAGVSLTICDGCHKPRHCGTLTAMLGYEPDKPRKVASNLCRECGLLWIYNHNQAMR